MLSPRRIRPFVFLMAFAVGTAQRAAAQANDPPANVEQGAPVSSATAPLPATAPPTATDQLLLPEEIILKLPEPLPPDAGMQPSRQSLPGFEFQLSPYEIQPLLPAVPKEFAGGGVLSNALRIRVQSFRFEGNHVFSDAALGKVVAKYAGREITAAELEDARQALTQKYVEAGYINSGAVLPDQDLQGGLVVFQVVEGKLTRIDVKGNWWLRPWWLRNELRRSAGKPLNFNELKTGLQLLRQNPNIRQINAELQPGTRPGESILSAEVKENQPFRFGFEVSNRRPPSVGAEIVDVHFSDLNLTGHSDPLSITWGVAHASAETIDAWEYAGDENLAGSYEIPITPWKTTLEVHASKSDAGIVEQQFAELDIRSQSTQYGATLRQPLYENLNHLLDVSLTGDWRSSKTFLLNRPFDLSPGSIEGKSQVFVLRTAQEYMNRSQQHVLALRSTFNFGLDAFDATRRVEVAGSAPGAGTPKTPDGRFFAWLGQGQFIWRLFNTDNQLVLRANAQFADHPLLSLEQFSLGGIASVRGYRENELLRDNGLFASVEIRVPVWKNKAKNPVVTLAPFFDLGAGWDTVQFGGPRPAVIDDRYKEIASVGLGLIVNPSRHCAGQLYWGYALNPGSTVKGGDNVQDYGLHFSLSFNAF
ncbi:MAG TPA: ShlB/FhaC/HecB family hemolysin secretion/activation protein [Chthoniobacteraceae bacterium]|nr:ShlB/FhaC/HecB family hemolysin secretion/activation protein [Chthoniobacteraceae bacterium]